MHPRTVVAPVSCSGHLCNTGLILLTLLCLPGCFRPVVCTTPSGVELARDPAPAVDCATLERWTVEVAQRWQASPCPEVRRVDVLALLRRSRDLGASARLHWRNARPTGREGLAWGRYLWADSRELYHHELTHALIEGAGLAPWSESKHHALMERCKI